MLRARSFRLVPLVAALLLCVQGAVGQPRASNSGVGWQQLLREAVQALDQGELKRSKELLTKVVAANPASVEAHTYLGVIADREGALPEAEKQFKAAVALAPSAATRNNYGAVLLRMGRIREAAVQFDRSLKLRPDQPAALVNLASIRFAEGTDSSVHSARELLQKAAALAPDSESLRALTIADCRLNDSNAAIKDYIRFKQISAGATPNEQKQQELGSALLNAGLFAQAIEQLQPIASAHPSDTGAAVMLAKAERGNGDVNGAGKTLESIVARNAANGDVYFELAKLYQQTNHLENAIPAMRLAIDADPDDVEYRFRYAILLIDAKAPAGAVMRVREAIDKFPSSAKLWFALGFAQLEDHKDSAARDALLTAAKLDPDYAPAQVFLGVAEFQLGHYKQAEAHYGRGIELAPKLAVLHEMLAEAMLREDPPNLQAAEAELRKCIALDSSFAPAHLELGKLLVRANDFPAASAELSEALRLNASLTEAYYQLGRVYRRLGKVDEANRLFEQFRLLSDKDKDQQMKERQELVHKLADTLF